MPTCIKHGRRIVFTTTSITHRNGDGSRCDSEEFRVSSEIPNATRSELHRFASLTILRERSFLDEIEYLEKDFDRML